MECRIASLLGRSLAAFAAFILATPMLHAQESAPPARPRIGLVLAGGGAKGGAHVGILKVLEEMRVPVDCIAGTSMGALVGAGYASGQTAAIGYCFGGATAQALAYSGAPLAGIVSFHGSLIPAPAEAAARNQAKFLICHGAADGFVPPAEIEAFQRSMNEGKFDYQFISYAGAVHAFTNPKADEIGRKAGIPIAYHAAADRRSWSHMRSFFAELFPGASR